MIGVGGAKHGEGRVLQTTAGFAVVKLNLHIAPDITPRLRSPLSHSRRCACLI